MGLSKDVLLAQNLRAAKNWATKAAKDFHFPQSVIEDVKQAKTIHEVNMIMQRARHKYL